MQQMSRFRQQLHKLFNQSVSSPQGQTKTQDNQDPQGHSTLTILPQGEINPTNDDPGLQGTISSILAPTAISNIQLDNSLKISLHTALQSETPYSEILQDLSGGTRQIVKNNLIFKRMNGMLVVHDQNQDTELDFWRIVVPETNEIKERIVQELHSTPYSAHPGTQRTIARVRRSFWWKGMLGDIRQFVENCPVCQMEKSDHTLAKGKLMSTQIPEMKWSEISIDFVTDLPLSANRRDTILVTVDKATRMVHLAPCRKKYNSNWNCSVAVEHCS